MKSEIKIKKYNIFNEIEDAYLAVLRNEYCGGVILGIGLTIFFNLNWNQLGIIYLFFVSLAFFFSSHRSSKIVNAFKRSFEEDRVKESVIHGISTIIMSISIFIIGYILFYLLLPTLMEALV